MIHVLVCSNTFKLVTKSDWHSRVNEVLQSPGHWFYLALFSFLVHFLINFLYMHVGPNYVEWIAFDISKERWRLSQLWKSQCHICRHNGELTCLSLWRISSRLDCMRLLLSSKETSTPTVVFPFFENTSFPLCGNTNYPNWQLKLGAHRPLETDIRNCE